MTRTVSAGNRRGLLSSWITGFIGFPASLRRVLKWVGEPDKALGGLTGVDCANVDRVKKLAHVGDSQAAAGERRFKQSWSDRRAQTPT